MNIEIPTTTYILPPSGFLANIFGVAGYILNNLFWILIFVIGLFLGIYLVQFIIDLFKE